MNKARILYLTLFMLVVLHSNCVSKQEKFDKKTWLEQGDPTYPPLHRKNMIQDLTANYKMIGIKYSELIALLGKPNVTDSTTLGYEIDVTYGIDIDPVYVKNLIFTFSKDSLITAYKVTEWKK